MGQITCRLLTLMSTPKREMSLPSPIKTVPECRTVGYKGGNTQTGTLLRLGFLAATATFDCVVPRAVHGTRLSLVENQQPRQCISEMSGPRSGVCACLLGGHFS